MRPITAFSNTQHALVLGVALILILFCWFSRKAQSQAPFSSRDEHISNPRWVVDVFGSVPNPGIYLFDHAPTLGEAIRKAGANPKGQVIVKRGNPHALQSAMAVHIVLSHRPNSTRVTVSPMDLGTAFIVGLPMDVNRAEASELSLVPGISDSLAGRIVGFRQTHGPFETWQDLEHVKGLGATTIARIKEHLQIK